MQRQCNVNETSRQKKPTLTALSFATLAQHGLLTANNQIAWCCLHGYSNQTQTSAK